MSAEDVNYVASHVLSYHRDARGQGWIMPIEKMREVIAYIMKVSEGYQRVKDCLKKFHFENEPLLEQIERLL